MIKVSFSLDDGSIYDLRSADMLNGYGYDATFYIPVNWQRYLLGKGIDPLTWDNIVDLATRFTIGSHGVNHDLLTRSSEDVQNREIFHSIKWWKEKGFDVNSFCYPRGYYDDKIKAKVRQAGYKDARTVKVGYIGEPEDPFETHTTAHLGYDRDEYETDWLTYAKDKVKEAIERDQDSHLRFWWHSEEVHRYQQWDRLGNFLRFLHENIEVPE